MKKIILTVFLAIILVGCGKSEDVNSQVSKSGLLKSKIGDEYVMVVDGDLVNVTSQKYDLNEYMGKNIKVEGMYSGSTLYVDEMMVE